MLNYLAKNEFYFEGVATVKMNRKPVNSLNFDILTQMTITLEKIQNDKSINGVIITSVSRNISIKLLCWMKTMYSGQYTTILSTDGSTKHQLYSLI